MGAYQHILLATGLADHADTVAIAAKELAQKFESKLSVVHVLEHTSLIYGSGEYSIPVDISIEEQLTATASQALITFANSISIAEADQYLLHGSTNNEVIKLATDINADLIIVGSHARHGSELLLGSTANAILHAAKCDVYAVNTR